ncbi:hypothetical protein WN55_01821 [Dufourea novaeangliae]|uniref:DUF4817 domain-containing protein n=1 Tax=Dufourea novaeangliae TaxID=178035 RepID=A0A154PG16_DUFNO|nr:hypothetical protein WN55_01821 [Dufourea novaeangliae]
MANVRAKNVYAARYPCRFQPSRRTFNNVCDKLRQIGSISVRKIERQKRVTNEENEIGVLASVVTKEKKYYGNKKRLVETNEWIGVDLTEEETRIKWIMNREARIEREKGKKVKVSYNKIWIAGEIWRWDEWEELLRDENGKTKERNEHLLENIPLHTRQTMWFQQDGCPAHSARIITQFLNVTFGDRWIGCAGNHKWPACSPDLTPLDFYLWGKLKQQVYNEILTTKEDMKELVSHK